MTAQEISLVLNASPLLEGCNIDIQEIYTRRCQAGQIVSDRIHNCAAIGVVAFGTVDVYSVAMDGREVQLNSLSMGDCFGISNLLYPAALDTVLRCRSETELLFIPKETLISTMQADAALAIRYAAYCNQKIQFLIHRIALLTMQSCRGKVIEYLLSQRRSDGKVVPGCSREDLARRLGISRAALFRELSFLQNRGLLALKGANLVVLDPSALELLL